MKLASLEGAMLHLGLQRTGRFGRRARARFRAIGRGMAARQAVAGVTFIPMLGYAPMVMDWWLFGVVAILGVAAGISIGVVYRYLHGQVEELRARAGDAEAELRAVLAVTSDAVLVLDSGGEVRAANPAAEKLLSLRADELCGREISDFISLSVSLPEVTREGPATFEVLPSCLGGKETPIQTVLSVVETAHGRRYVALMRCAGTNESALRLQVRKHCHDLNNQLTGVLGQVSLALGAGTLDQEVRERAVNAKRAALKAQEIVRNVQALAHGATADEPTESHATIVPMPAAAPSGTDQCPKIMILDDEPAICALVADALGDMGFEVLAKEDGPAAVQACEEAVRAGRRFDLVISDLSLPGELDGSKAVARMQRMDPKLKAIISSGYDQDPIMRRFRDYGFSGAIAKPFELSQLTRLVRDVLNANGHTRKSA